METLFVFGTLRFPREAKEAFGRVPKGAPDTLEGFKRGKRKLYGEDYPIILRKKDASVRGMVYEISLSELKRCDAYEDKMYQRIRVRLKSGTRAWVYALPKD